MRKLVYLIFLIFLVSCMSHKMEKAEMGIISKPTSDTIYEGQREVWPNVEYVEEEFQPASRDEEPEMAMSMPDEEIRIEHTPISAGGHPPPEESTMITHSIGSPISISEFTEGDIMYLIQDSMIVGEINVVNMTISYGVDNTEVIAEIETFSDESVYTETIRIAPVMKARLVDVSGNSFNIVPVTPEEQFLEFNSYTRWVWNVTPLSEGEHQLALSVDVVLNDKGKTIEVYDDFIYVYSTKSFFSKVWDFFLENWKWFASSLFLPIFYFLFKQFRKKS